MKKLIRWIQIKDADDMIDKMLVTLLVAVFAIGLSGHILLMLEMLA